MGAQLPLGFQWQWLLPVRSHLVAVCELLERAGQVATPLVVLALKLGLALDSLINLRLVLAQLFALEEGTEHGAVALRQRCGTRTGALVNAVRSRRDESQGTHLVRDRKIDLADSGELFLVAE